MRIMKKVRANFFLSRSLAQEYLKSKVFKPKMNENDVTGLDSPLKKLPHKEIENIRGVKK